MIETTEELISRLVKVSKQCLAQQCNLAYAGRTLADAAVAIAALDARIEELTAVRDGHE